MSIITQNSENEVAILDYVQRFFSSHKVGSLLKKCNGTKEKGVPAISLLRYKLSNIFVGRSMYMQQRIGSFREDFSKILFIVSNVFIIDDTMFNRTSCKKTELGSRVFDHVEMKYRKGFRLLTLGWSDGNTFLPINSCLLASSKESNLIGPTKEVDKR